MTFYKTCDQITETCDYRFSLPEYGKSTTDPSYFEPQASRIANMRNSASSASEGVYDFEDDPASSDIDRYHVPVGRKPGITFEEVFAMQEQNIQRIKANNKKISDERAAKEAAEQTMIDLANKVKNSDDLTVSNTVVEK